jgi:hypothetical protein
MKTSNALTQWIFPLFICVSFASMVSAQVSVDEAMTRMKERERQHPSPTQPASRPATKPASQPVVAPANKIPVLKANAPEDVKKFWELCRAEKPNEIKSLEDSIKLHQSYISNAKDEKAKQKINTDIKKLQDKLRIVKFSPAHISIPAIGNMHKAGSIGQLREGNLFYSIRVVQVIDSKNALIKAIGVRMVPRFASNKLVGHDSQGYELEPVWITGVDTTGWVDEAAADLKLSDCWRVSGTKTFATASGSPRTVAIIEPFDIHDWLEQGESK